MEAISNAAVMMSPVNIATATQSSTTGNGNCAAVARCATHALRKAIITQRPAEVAISLGVFRLCDRVSSWAIKVPPPAVNAATTGGNNIAVTYSGTVVKKTLILR